jgi:hypothetical protein
MKVSRIRLLTLIACTLAVSGIARGEDDVKLSNFGFLRADYGVGHDRYGAAGGFDTLGVGKFALGTKAMHDNVSATLVMGASVTTASATANPSGVYTADPIIQIRDAYITAEKIGGSSIGLRVGAQPLLFGLKSEGFPGDRSLQPSLEFGGANNKFNYANQAGPALKVWDDFGGVTATVGLFDSAGSAITRNFFGQLKATKLGVDGLYANAGYESVGGKSVFAVGAGYGNNMFDISAEFASIDLTLSQTTANEGLLIAELTVKPTSALSVYGDFGNASQASNKTIRVGAMYQFSKPVMAQAEYSIDDMNVGTDPTSWDFRLAYNF